MTDLEKAARMALEVLEQLQGGCTDSNDGTMEAITVWCPEVIAALRQALSSSVEQPAKQRHIAYVCPQCHWTLEEQPAQQSAERVEPVDWEAVAADQAMTIALLKSKDAAPVQEPVGTLNITSYKGLGNYDFDYLGSLPDGTYSVYTTPPAAPVQEPVMRRATREEKIVRPGVYEVPVNPPPTAQRQWVGLTQQDIDIAFDDTQEGGGFDEFARAIEAKLKEKNTGETK